MFNFSLAQNLTILEMIRCISWKSQMMISFFWPTGMCNTSKSPQKTCRSILKYRLKKWKKFFFSILDTKNFLVFCGQFPPSSWKMEKYIFQEQVGMIREKIRKFPQSTAVDQYQGGPVRVKTDSSNHLKSCAKFHTRLVLEHS